MLGDTVETVLKSYAKLLDQDCEKRAQAWLSATLHAESSHPNGNGFVPDTKLLNLIRLLKTNRANDKSEQELLHEIRAVLNEH